MTPVDLVGYILSGIFVVPLITGVIMYILSWVRNRVWWETNKLFYFMVTLHLTVQISTQFLMPDNAWEWLYSRGAIGLAAGNVLDISSEATFSLTYILFLVSWTELYKLLHKSWNLQRMKNSWKRISPNALAFLIICAIGALCIALMSIIIWAVNPSRRAYDRLVLMQATAIFLAVLLSTCVFIINSMCRYRMASRFKFKLFEGKDIKNYEVYKIWKKLVLIQVIFFASSTLRYIYYIIVFLLGYFKVTDVDSSVFAALWGMYFIVADLIPFSLITFVLIRYDYIPYVRQRRKLIETLDEPLLLEGGGAEPPGPITNTLSTTTSSNSSGGGGGDASAADGNNDSCAISS